MLKDSIYQDTISAFDLETYIESIEIIDRKKVGIKCGEWTTRNLSGQIIEIKHELKCNNK